MSYGPDVELCEHCVQLAAAEPGRLKQDCRRQYIRTEESHGGQGQMRILHNICASCMHSSGYIPLDLDVLAEVLRCGADLDTNSCNRPPPELVMRWRRKAQFQILEQWMCRL